MSNIRSIPEEDVSKTYKAEPTAREFHYSNEFVRGIRGPVGCVSADTEYLSPTGWRPIASYTGGLIAEWSPDGRMSFARPKRFIAEPCDEFITFETARSLSMVLSEEHQVPLYDYRGKFIVKRASALAQTPSRHRVPTTFKVTRKGLGLSEADIRLGVAIKADGHFARAGSQCIICVRKERKKVRIRELLTACGIEWKERVGSARPTELSFCFPRPKFTKSLEEWWDASSEDLAIILDELPHWDGLFVGPEFRFSTVLKGDADFVQYAVHALGGRATITEEKGPLNHPKWRSCYCVRAALKGSRKAPVCLRGDNLKISRTPSLDGMKYCFETSTGFFIARHADCVFVTGNSGKTSACIMELYTRALEQTPHNRVRRSRWALIRNCFDEKTEILTESRGFQFFRDLLPEDKVAMRDTDGSLVFVTPDSYYRKHFCGDLIGWKGEQLDFLVTPNHKHWARRKFSRKKTWLPPEFVKAEDMYGSHFKYRMQRNVEAWEGVDPGYSEAVFEFLGYWFAEGTAAVYPRKGCPGGTHKRWTLSTKFDYSYVRRLLKSIGLRYNTFRDDEGKYTFNLNMVDYPELYVDLMLCGKAKTKALPHWIKNAPRAHLQAFLRGFQQGDGSSARAVHKSTFLFTSSLQLANDLQEITAKAGLVANLRGRDRSGEAFTGTGFRPTGPEYTLTLCKKCKSQPLLGNTGWYRQPYDGTVYCLSVPTHVIYVRRNGVAYWTSQSYPELLSTTVKTFEEWIPPSICRVVKSTPIKGVLDVSLEDGTRVEAEFIFLALDQEDDVRKLKSLELTGAFINEASEVRKSVLDMLTSRMDRYPAKMSGGIKWTGIIMDTNPPSNKHWWYSLAEVEKPQGYKFWSQPPAMIKMVRDNGDVDYVPNDGTHPNYPKAENIDNHNSGFKYYERMLPGKDPEWIKTYILGEYGSVYDGKQVYHDYRDSVHCAGKKLDPYRGLPLLLAWDFGLTPACLIMQMTPRGQLRVLDELSSEEMGIERFARDIVRPFLSQSGSMYEGMVCSSVGDPAGTQRVQTNEVTCMQMLELQGFRCEPAPTNNFIVRKESVSWFLSKMVDGEPGFLMSPSCEMLREGFMGGYHYRRLRTSRGDRYAETPDKNEYSHLHDCLQYGCCHSRSASRDAGIGGFEVAQRSQRRNVKRGNFSAYC